MEGSLKIQTSRHAFLLQAWNTFTRHNEHWMALTVAREISSNEKVKPEDAAKEAISLIHLENYKDAESQLTPEAYTFRQKRGKLVVDTVNHRIRTRSG